MSADNSTVGEKNDDQLSSPAHVEPQPFYDGDQNNGDVEAHRTMTKEEEDDALHRVGSHSSEEEQAIISRVITGLSTASTSKRIKAQPNAPKMGKGRPYPPELGDREAYKVEWDGLDDPLHPFNWSTKQKVITCVALGYTTMCTAWTSSAFAPAVPYIAEEYHVIDVVAILGVSFYVFGFASGPVVWAPLSELYGRKVPLILSVGGLSIFTFAVAVSKDLQSILICRFFAGFIGAAPLVVVAGAFADMFNNKQRGLALAAFSGVVFCGPIVAPIACAFLASHRGWRWTMYLSGIMASAALVACIFLYEETYHPVILIHKAKEIRRLTGNWGVYAQQETISIDFNDLVTKNLTRPLRMLFTEPILFLLTVYTAFVYGILYLLLEAYPIIFEGGYGMNAGVSELPYLGLAIGMLIGMVSLLFYFEPRYVKAIEKNGWKPIPEGRLPCMIAGACAFPVGIFWLTWCGNYPKHVQFMAPTASGLFTGFGLLLIFIGAINYIIDAYLLFAASALAGNTFLRSAFGAVFPLFAGYMFKNMGTNWAGTLIGCVAVVLLPVPVLFLKYGKFLRQKSKFAFVLE